MYSNSIPLDRAYLIALWLETYLFGESTQVPQCAFPAYTRSFAEIGAYTIIFLTALYLLLWRRPRGVSWTLIVPLIILYTLATSVQSPRCTGVILHCCTPELTPSLSLFGAFKALLGGGTRNLEEPRNTFWRRQAPSTCMCLCVPSILVMLMLFPIVLTCSFT